MRTPIEKPANVSNIRDHRMRPLNRVLVHCSASDVGAHDDIEVIRKWHVEENKWDDIGYHFVITKDGSIAKGRDVAIAGAHSRGQNHDSIGICLTGDKVFSNDQFISLGALLQILQIEYGAMDIYPHNHFNKNKTCPNFTSNLFTK